MEVELIIKLLKIWVKKILVVTTSNCISKILAEPQLNLQLSSSSTESGLLPLLPLLLLQLTLELDVFVEGTIILILALLVATCNIDGYCCLINFICFEGARIN